MDTKVKTKYGWIEGLNKDGLNKWLGIPFAEPPIDKLRFKRARESQNWEGTKPCIKHGNKPIQFSPVKSKKTPKYLSAPESEDCLYLNIWRPNNEEQKLPVFVWIYGGGFSVGECSDPIYDGSALAKNDVIFIGFNYRVGVLGFYDFTIYNKDEFESNCGLSDQIMALRWIKENIERFGGDPNNITIAGESAGAASVCNLLVAPTAKGLFHKAISQSGLPGCVHTTNSTKKNMDLFMLEMKLEPNRVLELKTLPVESMKEPCSYVQANSCSLYPGIFQQGPVIDDLLPKSSVTALSNGIDVGVKLIIGTNHDEGSLFIMSKWFPHNWEMVKRMCEENNCKDKFSELQELYHNQGSVKNQMNLLGRDRAFLIDSVKVADGVSKHQDVWMYRFDYAPVILKLLGLNAMHGCEVPITLNTITAPGFLSKVWMFSSRKVRKKLVQDMNGTWINFVKHGDPNIDFEYEWPKYDEENRKTFVFNTQNVIENNPSKQNFQVWNDIKLYQ